MALLLKNIAFLLIVPGVVGALLPWALVRLIPAELPVDLGDWRYAAIAMMACGAALYTWCTFELVRFGQGIPSPTEPTRFLVRQGVYQHIRNPMYVAASLFLFGIASAFQRSILMGYATAVTFAYYPAVVFLEEPALRKRFGESYQQYCAQVPRWLPRLRP